MRVHDHPAKMLTTADVDARVCTVCGDPVDGGQVLRHRGEAVARPVMPARADVPAVKRAAAVAEQTLAGLVWTQPLPLKTIMVCGGW